MYEEGILGRQRIYSDQTEVTIDNYNQILQQTLPYHEANKQAIYNLLNYEKGNQPLIRKKVVRKDIDIVSTANLANQITEFKLGYNWGNPISIVQKSSVNAEKKQNIVQKIGNAIFGKNDTPMFKLNELFDEQDKDSKDQELARYVEICGIGYQMIKQNQNYEQDNVPFELITLNPLYTYIVYRSDIDRSPLCAITFTQTVEGSRTFYIWSKDSYFVIDGVIATVNDIKQETYSMNSSPYTNILGEIPIIEFNRSYDLMGCFERQMDEMNSLNVIQSDLANDIAQNTQAFWWGNDVEFQEDENGEVTLTGASIITTKTNGNGSKPEIKAMTSEYNYDGILSNIQMMYDKILEKAYVPKQTDSSGGSTGTAMSMTSGWAAAEASACKEALVLKKSFKERNRLALTAIKNIIDIYPSATNLKEIATLNYSDIDIKFTRQKTFDMATKVNSIKVMLDSYLDPAEIIKVADFFPDEAETINSSYDNMKKYQELMLQSLENKNTQQNNTSNTQQNAQMQTKTKTMQDSSDQTQNSPISSI